MSSIYVRDQIKAKLAASLPTETVVDLTGEFREINELITDLSITGSWLGIQFIGSDELPISVHSGGHGKYREYGVVYLHVVELSALGCGDLILARTEAIRNTFRGLRLGDMIIESITPPNFASGSTLELDGGFTSASVFLNYSRDINL